MSTHRRFIGRVVLLSQGRKLPTDFFTDLRDNHLIFIAETEMPPSGATRISSSADQLFDLIRKHRSKVEQAWPEINDKMRRTAAS